MVQCIMAIGGILLRLVLPSFGTRFAHIIQFVGMSLMSWLPESVMDYRMKKLATNIVKWSKDAGVDDVISLSEFR
jgi:hypothetical protein